MKYHWYTLPLINARREKLVREMQRRDNEMNERVLQQQIDEEGCGDFFARAIYQDPFFRN